MATETPLDLAAVQGDDELLDLFGSPGLVDLLDSDLADAELVRALDAWAALRRIEIAQVAHQRWALLRTVRIVCSAVQVVVALALIVLLYLL